MYRKQAVLNRLKCIQQSHLCQSLASPAVDQIPKEFKQEEKHYIQRFINLLN
jgi:hypothetical protein